ncbi:winged helix-turn-helix domain-containing protein [Scandinavium sp.]|uniref:winged helix-turn-helix domain-containing protein n=1 Tax=Scandinavium sp. TaxID=2830653 RepID=UPI002898B9AB|nr:winged helix-turn-helix domain-containing protein [Scandinavium sp.]
MHNHYIINNTLEFHPATSTLRDLHDPNNVVVLNYPASRCLLLLINRQGNIVTQHEVMDIVWEQSGMQVSLNTYYQNISILRKGLKKLGVVENLIVTIPRIGLTLASGTQVKKLVADHEAEIRHDHANAIHEQEDDSMSPGLTIETQHAPGDTKLFPPAQKASLRVLAHRLSIKQISSLILIIFILLTLFMAFAIGSDNATNHRYFETYSASISHGECRVFLSKNIKSKADKDKALSYVNRFERSCQNYPWLYISHFPMLPRTSIIRCDKPMSQHNTCISDYFFESNK